MTFVFNGDTFILVFSMPKQLVLKYFHILRNRETRAVSSIKKVFLRVKLNLWHFFCTDKLFRQNLLKLLQSI